MTSSKISTAPQPVGALAQAFQKAGRGRDQAHVAADRLDQDRREPVADAREMAVDVGQIVVARDGEIADDRARDAAERAASGVSADAPASCSARSKWPW